MSFFCPGRPGAARGGAHRAGRAPTPAGGGDVARRTPGTGAGSRAGPRAGRGRGRRSWRARACGRASRPAIRRCRARPRPAPPSASGCPKELPCAGRPGFYMAVGDAPGGPACARRRRPCVLERRRRPARRSARGALDTAAERGRRAVPAEGRGPPVPVRPLRRRGAVCAGGDVSQRCGRSCRRWRRDAAGRSSVRGSPRSRWRSPRASGLRRIRRTAGASARDAAGCLRRRSCARTSRGSGGPTRDSRRCVAWFAEAGVADRRAVPRALARAAAMSSDDPFLAAAAWIGRRHRGGCGVASAAAAAGWGRRGGPAPPVAGGVPRARADLVRRDRGRRPVPRPARRRDRRRTRCGRTAVGALRHALERAPALPPRRRDGFHGGLVGIAWAAVARGRAARRGGARERARAVVRHARLPSGPTAAPTSSRGSAGAIRGLLALGELLDEPALLAPATSAGDALVDRCLDHASRLVVGESRAPLPASPLRVRPRCGRDRLGAARAARGDRRRAVPRRRRAARSPTSGRGGSAGTGTGPICAPAGSAGARRDAPGAGAPARGATAKAGIALTRLRASKSRT